jgi:hypothetical protein
MTSTENWQTAFTDFWKGRSKIQQLAELTAVQGMAETAAENRRNSEAESAHVRRTLWGEQVADKSETDDMGNTTILGNVTHNVAPPMTQQPKQSSSLLPIVAAAAIGLAGGGIGAAAAAYALTDKDPAQEWTDETLRIGLGKIEDYTNGDESK